LEATYFSLLDIIPVFFWATIILVVALVVRSSKSHLPEYKYYMPNIFMKMFFACAYGAFYIYVYGGGDTTAFYDAAITLNNLFFKSPELYLEQMITTPNPYQFTTFYDTTTGYPPGWIYREPEGFFVSKIISILSFFTLKSYFAMSLIFSAFAAHASWKLFQLVRSYNFNNEKLIAFGILFLPSVNFWCTGVSKDSVIFIAALYLISHAFTIISSEHKSKFRNYAMVILMSFLIYHIRNFVLVAIIVPLLFSISARLVKAFGGGNMAVITFRTLILIVGIVGIGRSFILQSEQDFLSSNSALQEASVIQKDFQTNETYGNKKYDLGDVQFTSIGLIKVMPLAIVTGIYRPFIWEALSPTLILNGLESIIFLYFTFLFFRRNFIQKWNFIRGHELLIFCLVFILIIGFMTGMTSILYGVLVRLRSPLLPFLMILLTLKITPKKTVEENV
jgi:hypothetical protein